MLYKLAHILRDRFGFIWNMVEWLNALLFAMMHKKQLAKIPEILQGFSDKFTLRLANVIDAKPLVQFFTEQPEEAFKFFKPHGFDEKSLTKIIKNRAFLTFLVLDGEKIVGYFFLRCFVNGNSFKGYIVGDAYKGQGIAKLEGLAMNMVNEMLGLRMFGSISPENPASMAVAKAVNEIRVVETLENGDLYIEFLPKTGNVL